MDIKDTDWAYLAGLLDADGSISIHQTVRQILSQMSIASQDYDTLQWISSMFGGRVREQRSKGVLCVYVWAPGRGQTAFILKGMMPYLKIKRKQAELLLEYVTRPHKFMTEEQRLYFTTTSKSLNQELPKRMKENK